MSLKVGPPGGGKDTSIGAARDAVDVKVRESGGDAAEITELTPGSGEGIAHSCVRREGKHWFSTRRQSSSPVGYV
jgi:hypothetical protein